MRTVVGSSHITPAGGNVFADLGFPPDEAAALKARSDRCIRQEQELKAQLVSSIADWISLGALNIDEGAQILGVNRHEWSEIVNKKHESFSIGQLVRLILRTDLSVRFVVE